MKMGLSTPILMFESCSVLKKDHSLTTRNSGGRLGVGVGVGVAAHDSEAGISYVVRVYVNLGYSVSTTNPLSPQKNPHIFLSSNSYDLVFNVW